MAGAKRLARAADFAGLLAWRKGTLIGRGRLKPTATLGRSKVRPLQSSLAAFPWRKSATVAGEHYIRLTVARRRRYCTVFPSTKSAVDVEGQSPLRAKDVGGVGPVCDRQAAGLGWTRKPLFICKKRHARPAGRSDLHGKRRLKNLLENFALEHGCRRTNAKTFATLHQDHLVRVFTR